MTSDRTGCDRRDSGPGTAGAEGEAAPPTSAKLAISPMTLHGRKWAKNRSYPSDFAENIVGAEYIVCTHWLNIVGAAAPTAPMVLTPMLPEVRVVGLHTCAPIFHIKETVETIVCK